MQLTQKDKARLEYVDLFRGFGILLMMMGHVGFGRLFDIFIHSFHMPMFFFISGYFYKSKTDIFFKDLVCRKAKSLLVPYFIFAFIHYCVYFLIVVRRFELHSLISFVFNSSNPTIPIAGALWFLTALFLTDIIYMIIDSFYFSMKAKTCLIILLVLLGMLFGNVIPIRLPFSLDISLVCLGYYHLARTMKEYGSKCVIDMLRLKLPYILLITAIPF